MPRLNLPSWLPPEFTAHLPGLFEASVKDEKGQIRVQSLVNAPGMEQVLKTLLRLNADPVALKQFAYSAAVSPRLTEGKKTLPSISHREERLRLQKVLKAALALQNSLVELGKESGPRALAIGLAKLQIAAWNALSHAVAAGNPERTPLLFLRWQSFRHADADSAIEAIISAAQEALRAPRPPSPRKLKDKHALRTAYVQELAKTVQHHFGKPLYEEVATVANLMFEDADKPLTGNLVRKLIPTKRRKISAKAP